VNHVGLLKFPIKEYKMHKKFKFLLKRKDLNNEMLLPSYNLFLKLLINVFITDSSKID
jgi:hypothetical protein